MRGRRASALVDRESLLTDARLLLSEKRAVLGVKSADIRAFPKERPRGPTALRKALLACPKTVAAMFLRAFESSRRLPPDRCVLPCSEGGGELAQNHMNCVCWSFPLEAVEFRVVTRSGLVCGQAGFPVSTTISGSSVPDFARLLSRVAETAGSAGRMSI